MDMLKAFHNLTLVSFCLFAKWSRVFFYKVEGVSLAVGLKLGEVRSSPAS